MTRNTEDWDLRRCETFLPEWKKCLSMKIKVTIDHNQEDDIQKRPKERSGRGHGLHDSRAGFL